MRILHIGFVIPGLIKAFSEKSSDYKFFDWSDWTAIPGNLRNLHQETIKVSKEFKPDLTFMQIQAPDVYDLHTVDKLGGFVLNWTWDYRPNPKWMYELAPAVDLSGFTNEKDVKDFRDRGYSAEFIQSGFDDEVFRPDGDVIDHPEIVFIGNNYKNEGYDFAMGDYRIEMVNFLMGHYGENFGVYGFGWTNPLNNFMYREAKESRCYRSCKIAINLSHYEIDRYSSDRILRLMGSGAFCLCKWYPGIDKDFEDGVHLRVWKTLDDLKDLIDYYLKHDDERIRIANNGCELVRNNYTWNDMVDRIKRFV